VDDAEDIESASAPVRSSALAAVMPLPPTAAPVEEDEDMDDAPEDAEPIPLPIAKKAPTIVKRVVSKKA
jgi:hypothetical protein